MEKPALPFYSEDKNMESAIADKMRLSLQESNDELDKIIDNDLKFKQKLKIGDSAFKYLKTAKNLKNIGEASATGAGIAAITGAGWYMSMGVLGKFALAAGLATTPVGWIAGAGAAGALGVLGLKKMFGKVGEKTMDNIPKFLGTPLDAVALSVSQIIFPPAIRIACVDNDFCSAERDVIQTYFTNEWGYNNNYVNKTIDLYSQKTSAIDYRLFKDMLNKICSTTKELKKDKIINDLLSFLEDVIRADGKVTPEESNEFEYLKLILQGK